MHRLRKRLATPNALLTFEAAARHLSFTRAAAELFVSQAAVSRQIRRLEDRLGTDRPRFRKQGTDHDFRHENRGLSPPEHVPAQAL